jgi:hypothetical protein
MYAAVAVLAVAIGVAASSAIVLTGGGGSTTSAPPAGLHLVQSRGPVAHALLEPVGRSESTTLDLAAGRSRPTRVTWEVWWDPRGGLFRTVYRYDDRVVSDIVQKGCQGSGRTRFCLPPSPFDLTSRGWAGRRSRTSRDGWARDAFATAQWSGSRAAARRSPTTRPRTSRSLYARSRAVAVGTAASSASMRGAGQGDGRRSPGCRVREGATARAGRLTVRRSQHRELVGDLEAPRAEAVEGGRPPAGAARLSAFARRLEDAAP